MKVNEFFKLPISVTKGRRNLNRRKSYICMIKHGELEKIRILKKSITKRLFAELKNLDIENEMSCLRVHQCQKDLSKLFDSRFISNASLSLYKHKRNNARALLDTRAFSDERLTEDWFLNSRAKRAFYELEQVVLSFVKVFTFIYWIIKTNQTECRTDNIDTFLIGHTASQVIQDTTQNEYTFVNWLNLNSINCKKILMCQQREFFIFKWQQIDQSNRKTNLLASLSREFIRVLRNFDSTGILRWKNLDQLMFSAFIEAFSEYFQGDKLFFSESTGNIRPYWTYHSKLAGSKITYLQFSTSAQLKIPNGIESNNYPNEFDLCTWERLMFTSEYSYEKWSRNDLKLITNAWTSRVEFPWLFDCEKHRPCLNRPFITVFDYFSPNDFYGYASLNDLGFYSASLNQDFLEPLLQVCSDLGINMYRKKKRNIKLTSLEKSNQVYLESLFKNRNYYEVCSKVSPHRIIQGSIGVISLPPTSTALIARDLGVPSIYFDPYGRVQRDDFALEGIEIVSTPREIEQWVLRNLETN